MNAAASKPLVYSCSGCSSAAQLANAVALKLDRAEIAEMSCIAGVGGDVPSLVRLARSGRPIVALDGCALACVKNSLARHGLAPAVHVLLSEQGVRKRYHADFDPVQAQRVFADVGRRIARAMHNVDARASAHNQPAIGEGACS
ncbi:MAG: putative zinc-binding protein [Burkholderiales bacterium]|nr:putative zinc-binding protein [Burkholderiales bacterium]